MKEKIAEIIKKCLLLGAVLLIHRYLFFGMQYVTAKLYEYYYFRFNNYSVFDIYLNHLHSEFNPSMSSLWIIAVFLLMEGTIFILGLKTGKRSIIAILYLASMHFQFLFMPIRSHILAATDFICLLLIFIKWYRDTHNQVNNKLLLALVHDNNYHIIRDSRIIIFIIIMMSSWHPFLAITKTNGLLSYVENKSKGILGTLTHSIELLLFALLFIAIIYCVLNAYRRIKMVENKADCGINQGKPFFFVVPVKLNYYETYDRSDSSIKSLKRALEYSDYDIRTVTLEHYELHLKQYWRNSSLVKFIFVLFANGEDLKPNKMAENQSKIDYITSNQSENTMVLSCFYGESEIYEKYKHLFPISYKTIVDSDRILLDFNETNNVVQTIQEMCKHSSKHNAYYELLHDIYKELETEDKDCIKWIYKELGAIIYNGDNVEALYSMMKITEYSLHLFFLVNIGTIYEEEKLREVLYKGLNDASVGSFYDLICKRNIKKQTILAEHWNMELEKDSDEIKEALGFLYSTIGLKTRIRKLTIQELIEFTIAFRNKTFGHGVISPYYISEEVTTKFALVMAKCIRYIMNLSIHLEEFYNCIYMNYSGRGYDLSELVRIKENEVYLFNGSLNSVKEYICYKNGSVIRNHRPVIDCGIRM